jgi:hypothetical protein
VGAGQVGPGSLYGMQALHRLAGGGFSVWPFDVPELPLVVEIYPRLLTGTVVKSDRAARIRYIEERSPELALVQTAVSSEDAFDAAVSALAMAASVDELLGLEAVPEFSLEGCIWAPTRAAVTRAVSSPRQARADADLDHRVELVARVIAEASARGESAREQAQRVIAALDLSSS